MLTKPFFLLDTFLSNTNKLINQRTNLENWGKQIIREGILESPTLCFANSSTICTGCYYCSQIKVRSLIKKNYKLGEKIKNNKFTFIFGYLPYWRTYATITTSSSDPPVVWPAAQIEACKGKWNTHFLKQKNNKIN